MIERLIVRLIGDGTSFMRMMKDASNITRQFGMTMTQIGRSVTRLGRNLTLFLTAPIIGLGVASLTASVRMETMLIRLQALVGSAEKGAEQFEKIKKFSIPSPFLLQDLLNINNRLVGFGMEPDQAFEAMTRLADIAALTTNNFPRLAIAFGQAFADEKLRQRDITQFINSNVPLLKLLKATMGVTGEEIRELSTKGKLGFDLLWEAIVATTSAGGDFERGTEKLAATTQGKMAQFADRITLVKASFGDLLKEGFEPLLDKALELSEKMENLDKEFRRQIISTLKLAAVIGPLVIVFGVGVIFLGQTITLVGILSKGLFGLAAAATAALGPYGTLAALVVGGTAAGVTATTAMKSGGPKEGSAGFLDSIDLIKERWITLVRIMARTFNLIFGISLREFTVDLAQNIILAFKSVIPTLVKIFTFLVQTINSLIKGRKGPHTGQFLELIDGIVKEVANQTPDLTFADVPRKVAEFAAEEFENERIRRGSNIPAPSHAARLKEVRAVEKEITQARNFLQRNAKAIAVATAGEYFEAGGGPKNPAIFEMQIRSVQGARRPFTPDQLKIMNARIPTTAEFLGAVGEAGKQEATTVLKDSRDLLNKYLPLILEKTGIDAEAIGLGP